jgi:hypothetical protein
VGDYLLHIVDLSLSGILDHLTTEAWSRPCRDPEGSFLLSPIGLASGSHSQGLSRTLNRLYEHARNWAPGLDIPSFVPPVRIAALKVAGHFLLDEESYASITVSTEFLGNVDATSLILAHEACHHILLQAGISFQFKNDVMQNERITDLSMFVCGFGEIVRRGRPVVRRSHGQYVNTHLGYLDSRECDAAFRYVLEKRRTEQLPGIPIRPSFWTGLSNLVSRLAKPPFRSGGGQTLLEKVVEETERRKRHRRDS